MAAATVSACVWEFWPVFVGSCSRALGLLGSRLGVCSVANDGSCLNWVLPAVALALPARTSPSWEAMDWRGVAR